MLRFFAGFWGTTEPVIDRWAQQNPVAAEQLRWSRRRRSVLLRADVAMLSRRLGIADRELPAAEPVFVRAGDADVLGWLYVSEGSTLGGAVVERRLRPAIARAGMRLRSFTPYDEGPGPMWREFQQHLAEWSDADSNRTERVIAAGVRTFAALDHWVAPIRKDVSP